jgi:hypothetical protein
VNTFLQQLKKSTSVFEPFSLRWPAQRQAHDGEEFSVIGHTVTVPIAAFVSCTAGLKGLCCVAVVGKAWL